MCNIYTSTDPILYESRTRSVRILGVVTTIRMENAFWDVLQEMAESEKTTTNHLISNLYEELVGCREGGGNFASFLRVCCLRYLAAKERGETLSQPSMFLRIVKQ
ncbi:ribbon-helix-helix domain-containing protein [Acidocella sp.]|uniref:ribbon-helix-helix domain-containing protein n=1 Tax=Acidocella sp. TaxID=50710 RepID=UPI003D023CCB